MRTLQDKTINSTLRYLHRQCMNGRHDGLEHVLALMRLRGVEPEFKAFSKPYGSRRERRLAKHRALRLVAEKPANAEHDETRADRSGRPFRQERACARNP